MSKYSASGTGAATTGTAEPLAILVSSATIRTKLYDLIIGSDGTPGDVATRFDLGLHTTQGTGGSAAFTPTLLDPVSAASGATFKDASTIWSADPTLTAASQRLMISLNQRATFRWVAAPGSEIIAIAATNNGLELRSVTSTGTPTYAFTFLWYE